MSKIHRIVNNGFYNFTDDKTLVKTNDLDALEKDRDMYKGLYEQSIEENKQGLAVVEEERDTYLEECEEMEIQRDQARREMRNCRQCEIKAQHIEILEKHLSEIAKHKAILEPLPMIIVKSKEDLEKLIKERIEPDLKEGE